MTESYCVIFRKPEPPPLDKVAQVVAAFKKVPLLDARRLANHAWGFLGERLTEGEAQALAGEAARAGLETVTLKEAALAAVPGAAAVHTAGCDGDGFFYSAGSETQRRKIPWSDVRALAVLALQEEFSVLKTVKEGPSARERAVKIGITLLTGIPMGMGKSKDVKKTVTQSDLYLYMDVFVKDAGGLARLHMDIQKFNFGYLGERLQMQALGNFRLFLEDTAKGAPQAVRNKGARVVLAKEPFNTMGYLSHADYEKELRWLLTILP